MSFDVFYYLLQECKAEYFELRRQCQQLAVELLDRTRTSNELAIILNYDPEMATYKPGDRMSLTRLTQAIYYKQKKVRAQETNNIFHKFAFTH